jgi:hypothetical protein
MLVASTKRGLQMQLDVLVFRGRPGDPPTLLVVPRGQRHIIPPHLQGVHWQQIATVPAREGILGGSSRRVRAEVRRNGYSLVQPGG